MSSLGSRRRSRCYGRRSGGRPSCPSPWLLHFRPNRWCGRQGTPQVGLGLERCLRQASRDQRARVALARLVFRRRRSNLGEESMEPSRSVLGRSPELVVEDHLIPAPPRPIEEVAAGHTHVEHLLQTQCLRTQLYFVCAMALRAAALVLDRSWCPTSPAPVKRNAGSAPDPLELDHIGPSRQAQLCRAHREASQDDQVFPRLVLSRVSPSVHASPLHREAIVHPSLLLMDEGALTLAVQEVLDGAQRDEFVVRVHVTP